MSKVPETAVTYIVSCVRMFYIILQWYLFSYEITQATSYR